MPLPDASTQEGSRYQREPREVYREKPRDCPDLLKQMLSWHGKTRRAKGWPKLPPDLQQRFDQMKKGLTRRR